MGSYISEVGVLKHLKVLRRGLTDERQPYFLNFDVHDVPLSYSTTQDLMTISILCHSIHWMS